MIRKDGKELDLAMLATFCRERKLQHQETITTVMNSKLDEIARSFPNEEEARYRPYGVEHEGQAYDVWEQILEKVTDPEDICVLWEVCMMFRTMLRKKYIATQLPKIVKLILENYLNFLVPPARPEVRRQYEEWWRVRNAKVSTFLNLRLISRQCKASIEHISHSGKCDLTHLSLRSALKVEMIFDSLKANPSIAASTFPTNIKINDDDLESVQEEITTILELVGHRITFFECRFERDFNYHSHIYDSLRRWAGSMPNLEHLSFNAYTDDNYDHKHPPPLNEVEAFPSLPRLRVYNENWAVLSTPYVRRILEACPGVTEIGLTEMSPWGPREDSPKLVETVETLEHLTCLRTYPYDSLFQHHHLPWKLSKLVFNKLGPAIFEYYWKPKAIVPSDRLFVFLKQFEDTLEYLEFDKVMLTFPTDGFLGLRNLKTLLIEFDQSFENLNFLLYTEKLETLRVEFGNGYENAMVWPQEKLDGIMRSSFLGMSVWDVFPSLKSFNITTENYDDYLEHYRTH